MDYGIIYKKLEKIREEKGTIEEEDIKRFVKNVFGDVDVKIWEFEVCYTLVWMIEIYKNGELIDKLML